MPFRARPLIKLITINFLPTNLNIFKRECPNGYTKKSKSVFPEDVPGATDALNASSRVTLAPLGRNVILSEGKNLFEPGKIIETSRLVSSMGDIGELEDLKNGKALVVDQGSQLVVQCVDGQPTDKVFDMCCAPGGKSFLLAQECTHVVSSDLGFSRMRKFRETQERIGADNVFPLVCDATQLPLDARHHFDRVLVDAPCSGLGVLRRRPDARHRMTPESVSELVELQKKILTSVITHVPSGAYLIYSVCTFTTKETQGIDEWLQSNYPELVADDLSDISPALTKRGRGFLLAPTVQSDAMYVLRLRKA